MDKKEFYEQLIHRYIANKATEEELEAFFALLASEDMDSELHALLAEEADKKENGLLVKHRRRIWPRIAAAASIIAVLSAGGYVMFKPKPTERQTAQLHNDLTPGINGAVLTLGNGQKVVLEQTQVGTIAAGVKKSNDSLLVYNDSKVAGYNTLETPKGRQYSVVLPDGSKVWLNAASSLKYPTRFTKERLVELTGEAYFEVVHNSKMPFRVKSNGQITEDIGTSFNINSYSDEPGSTTTLIEGAIKVNNSLVKPGQAAILINNHLSIKAVDTEEAVAWKNGAFSYNNADIKTVMRQFARWYDVAVEYEGELPKTGITGKVHRNVNASQALQILTYLNIHYRIDGKKIIIIK